MGYEARMEVAALAERVTPAARSEIVRSIARRTGRHPETVRTWLRGERQPRGTARTLLVQELRQAPKLPE